MNTLANTLDKMNQLRQEGWCLDIFIPSGKPPYKKNRVMVRYDNQGPILRQEATTLEEAIQLVWTATGHAHLPDTTIVTDEYRVGGLAEAPLPYQPPASQPPAADLDAFRQQVTTELADLRSSHSKSPDIVPVAELALTPAEWKRYNQIINDLAGRLGITLD